MSDNGNSVTCEAHGDRQAAFVCQHLLSGSGLGFNWAEDSENPDAHCPDAWCDTCNTALEAAGEWTESAMALANIKLVCDFAMNNCASAIGWRTQKNLVGSSAKPCPFWRKDRRACGRNFGSANKPPA
jgi:hypothetical protein